MIAKARTARGALGVILCLGFTGAAVARADDSQPLNREGLPLWSDDPTLLPTPTVAQPVGGALAASAEIGEPALDEHGRDRWVDSPYAPHDTTGANVRIGSAVGRVVHDGGRYTALGATLAGGPRMGRYTLEGHYTYLELSAPGPSSQRFGSAHRLGVMGRADLVRLGSNVIGANSLLTLYGEAGLFHQLHRWLRPGVYERREVPLAGGRAGAVVGFGFNLDFRLEQPRGFPHRVGWQLGWQLTSSDEHEPGPTMICRGVSCRVQPGDDGAATRDTSMLLTSTIAFTW